MTKVTSQMVADLRNRTGAAIMDCKTALSEANGELEQAIEILRKKGATNSSKRAGRATHEGAITSYLHGGGRIGVLIEVNCETDFVARTADFSDLSRNLAMQIAAASPLYIQREDVPAAVVAKETEILTHQAKDSGKPEDIIPKIIEGKLDKFFEETCLLEQPYIKDSDKRIRDLIQEASGKFGENVSVHRFARFAVGNGGNWAETS